MKVQKVLGHIMYIANFNNIIIWKHWNPLDKSLCVWMKNLKS